MISSVSSTEKDINTRLTKAWTAIDRLLIIWRSNLTDKMKRSFFQAAVISILLYGCTTRTLTKQLEKKLNGNYTRMLWAILNKSRRQHPNKAPTIRPPASHHKNHPSWTNQICRTLLEKQGWAHKWSTPMDPEQKQNDQREHTYSSYVRIWDVSLKTFRRRWTIGRKAERESGISVRAAWHDDDDEDSFKRFVLGMTLNYIW